MAEQTPTKPPTSSKEEITRITVSGFKSIHQQQSIEIKPLTILAGANSSGKSSIMQPLLLLKQTLEAPYDPGPLLLNGPNVKFTSAVQFFSLPHNDQSTNTFHIGLATTEGFALTTVFKQSTSKGFDLKETIYSDFDAGESFRLFIGMSEDEVQSVYARTYQSLYDKVVSLTPTVMEDRCFLELYGLLNNRAIPLIFYKLFIRSSIEHIIHLPGLRGSPERNYPVTAVGPTFPGTFEYYVASIIEHWQTDNVKEKLEALNNDLARLALTKQVVARRRDDTQLELMVQRLLRNNNEDMVSIADVGLGVSQALPVVVALHTAHPGQLVYIEQPEIHLHPRAQSLMAEVLADAAIQGKRLIVETHSALLLRGVQTLVAEGKLPPELVKLHWFRLGPDGSTEISSADLDELGAYGDWPEDFDTVMLESEHRYLSAAEEKLSQGD